MGTLSGGDGGGWPPDELPDLPPEWGTIVIPDDAAELADEAGRVRRQLRREAREQRWRRRLHLPPAKPRSGDDDATTLGVPLLVISIAVIATLTSLFAIAWPAHPQRPDLQPTAVATTPVSTPGAGSGNPSSGTSGAPDTGTAPTGTATPHALGLPDVALLDPAGAPLRLRRALPAVILLVDGCDCARLVAATAAAVAAVNPAISTVAVGRRQVPAVAGTPVGRLRAATDPGGVLRSEVPGSGPSALLVGANAALVRIVPVVSTVDDFRADLTKLV
jgi:hypothetical protein